MLARSLLLFLLALTLTAPALASRADDVQQSEYHRLVGELRSLTQRQAWTGVERTYRALLDTGVPLTALDHRRGADAARALGDVASTRARLLASVRLQVERDAIELLYTIDTTLGRVDLAGTELVADDPPWLPEQRAAIAFAAQQLADGHPFDGYLPPGSYRLDGVSLQVEAGGRHTLHTDAAPTVRRRR
jgi:hypothetical protein